MAEPRESGGARAVDAWPTTPADAVTTTRVPAPPRGPALLTLQTLPAAALPPSFLPPIRALHAACFPADALPADASDAAFLDRVAWLHEPGECVWILGWQGGEAPAVVRCGEGGVGGARPPPPPPSPPLIAMVTAVPYPAALFGFNLAVHPSWRGRGLGRRVMHELQAAALNRFNLGAISATVDAAGAPALVRYYCSFGGVVEATGVGAPASLPPPTVRVVRRFDAAGLAAATAEADAALAEGGGRASAWRRAWKRVVRRAACGGGR